MRCANAPVQPRKPSVRAFNVCVGLRYEPRAGQPFCEADWIAAVIGARSLEPLKTLTSLKASLLRLPRAINAPKRSILSALNPSRSAARPMARRRETSPPLACQARAHAEPYWWRVFVSARLLRRAGLEGARDVVSACIRANGNRLSSTQRA
jgi:hypothetical protein